MEKETGTLSYSIGEKRREHGATPKADKERKKRKEFRNSIPHSIHFGESLWAMWSKMLFCMCLLMMFGSWPQVKNFATAAAFAMHQQNCITIRFIIQFHRRYFSTSCAKVFNTPLLGEKYTEFSHTVCLVKNG